MNKFLSTMDKDTGKTKRNMTFKEKNVDISLKSSNNLVIIYTNTKFFFLILCQI